VGADENLRGVKIARRNTPPNANGPGDSVPFRRYLDRRPTRDGLTPGADKASDVRAYENNSPVRSSRRTRLSLIAAFNPLLTKIALMDYLGRNYLVSEQLFRAASSTNRRQK
jgi:hypothetical protein